MFGYFRRRREAKDQTILSLLQQKGEMSSFDIGQAVNWSVATLFPALSRMEHDGRLSSRWGDATAARGWRRARLYRIPSP